MNVVIPNSFVLFDAEVLLSSTENNNQSKLPVRLVAYRVDGVNYRITTNRRDLTGEQVAEASKLRWKIKNFVAWWKRHLRVYHMTALSQ